jgi:ERF superfamily
MSEPAPALKPEEAPKPKSLSQKILEIQAAVGAVKKRGKFGTEMGNASYLRIEDAVSAVGKLMTDRGLILTGTLQTKPDGSYYYERTPGTSKGYMVSLVMQWTIEDTETGASRTWSIPGEGYDGTDKGTPKAQTSSRKYAIIDIFNLAVGNDVEAGRSWEEGKDAQKDVVRKQLLAGAKSDNPKVRETALQGLDSQVEAPKALVITRPEEFNGHYFIASGLIAVPELDRFFEDTDSKRLNSKKTGKIGWKVSADYEKSLIDLCERLKIEVE